MKGKQQQQQQQQQHHQRRRRSSLLQRGAHLSFSGCGFLGIYHVGVASAFREYAPQIAERKVMGTSSGALAACCLVNDLPFDVAVTSILRMATQSRRRALGPFHPSFNINTILFEDLGKILPEDAHIRSTGRLHICVTRLATLESQTVSEYATRTDLINTLMASCFIPIFSGYVPPIVNGERCVDGGFSCNLLVCDESTITVSPFSGESDICPQDESFNLSCVQISNTSIAVSPANLYRIKRIMFAPHPDVLAKMCQQGFDDAIKYLKRHQLISCLRCLAVESTLLLPPQAATPTTNATAATTNSTTTTGSTRTTSSTRTVSTADTPTPKTTTAAATPMNGMLTPAVPANDENHDKHERTAQDSACVKDCAECDIANRLAVAASLSERVEQPCKDAANALNQSLYNWLFKTRTMRLLALATAPIVLPLDVTYLAARTAVHKMVDSSATLVDTLAASLQRAGQLVSRATISTTHHAQLGSGAGRISCQLAIHEFSRTPAPGRPRSRTLENGQTAVRPPARVRPKRRSYAGIEKRLVSELNLGFSVEMENEVTKSRTSNILRTMNSTEDLPSVDAAVLLTNDALQRNASQIRSINAIVNVTRERDALMKFFYTDDETNSVRVTEIFDLTSNS